MIEYPLSLSKLNLATKNIKREKPLITEIMLNDIKHETEIDTEAGQTPISLKTFPNFGLIPAIVPVFRNPIAFF